MSENGNKLILGTVAGDEWNYHTLFHNYYRVFTVFVEKEMGDLDESREKVQGVFVKFMNPSSLEDVVYPKSYLFKSEQNNWIKQLIKKQLHQGHKQMMQFLLEETKEDVSEKVYVSELEQRIFEIISELPDKCQQRGTGIVNHFKRG